jgi:hypothetical protein
MPSSSCLKEVNATFVKYVLQLWAERFCDPEGKNRVNHGDTGGHGERQERFNHNEHDGHNAKQDFAFRRARPCRRG